MTETRILDVLLILLLLGYLVYGYRSGFVSSLSAIVGMVVGAIAAFFVIPLLGGWIPNSSWRALATLGAALVLVLTGHSAGVAVGRVLRRQVDKAKLYVPDRLLGAALTGVVAALITSTLAMSLASLGIPILSRAIGSSTVLSTLETATPDPVQRILAQLRSFAVHKGLPLITETIGGITTAPELPAADTDNPEHATAAQSVVRIRGNAAACAHSQRGSGFVVATDRILTNAHVVSGVVDPTVKTLAGNVLEGRIVYFDATNDLAVIAVDGLSVPPLELSQTAVVGNTGVVDGYPFGGPFTSRPAEVLSVDTVNVANIYGDSPAPREVYSLAANVQQGGSGGPFLDRSGVVIGVVFAKSANIANLGYAMTMAELSPVAAQAPSLSQPVTSGACVRG